MKENIFLKWEKQNGNWSQIIGKLGEQKCENVERKKICGVWKIIR